jgi:hypothetical protein
MSKSPEEIINEFGGPSTLNIQFVRIVREADDKGKEANENDIFSEIAKQIGVEPIHVKTALQEFWRPKPPPRSRSDLIAPY